MIIRFFCDSEIRNVHDETVCMESGGGKSISCGFLRSARVKAG